MSHSQFHSIEAFILRHAWLSLWDKHMTTGRINQVTTAGRGSAHPTTGASPPLGTLPPGAGCPRLPNRPSLSVFSLAKPPAPYPNGRTTTGCPVAGPRPCRSCRISPSTGASSAQCCFAFWAQTVQPPRSSCRHAHAGPTTRPARAARSHSTLLSRPGNASAGWNNRTQHPSNTLNRTTSLSNRQLIQHPPTPSHTTALMEASMSTPHMEVN